MPHFAAFELAIGTCRHHLPMVRVVHSILMTVDHEFTDEDRRRLANLGTKLNLMLNLSKRANSQIKVLLDYAASILFMEN